MSDPYEQMSSDVEDLLSGELIFTSSKQSINKSGRKLSANISAKNKRKYEIPRLTAKEAGEIIKRAFYQGLIVPIKHFHVNCIPEFNGRQLNYKNADCVLSGCSHHEKISTYLQHFQSIIDTVMLEELYVVRDDNIAKDLTLKYFLYYICQNEFSYLKSNILKYNEENAEPADLSVLQFLQELKSKNDWSEIEILEEAIQKMFNLIDSLDIQTDKVDISQFTGKNITNLEIAVKERAKSILRSLMYDYELEMLLVNMLPMEESIRIQDLWPMLSVIFGIPNIDIMNFKTKIFDLESINIQAKITKSDEYAEMVPISSLKYEFQGDLEAVISYLEKNGAKDGQLLQFNKFHNGFLHKKIVAIHEALFQMKNNVNVLQFNADLNCLYPELVELMDNIYDMSSYDKEGKSIDLNPKELFWVFYLKEIDQTEKEIGKPGILVTANGKNLYQRFHG